MKMCRSNKSGAFTLIELMIAIAIFAGVLLAIYSSWTAILRASQVGLAATAEAQRTRMTLRAIHEAFSSAELFTANIHHYSFLSDTSGDFAAVSFVARLPASFPGSGLFGDQAVRRVTFSVEPGPNAHPQLVLRQSPLLEPVDAAAKPYSIVLAPAVKVFQLEFLDTNTFEWMPEWPATNQLPRVVRVALSFDASSGPVRDQDISVRTVPITSVAIPRELQVPAIRRGMGVVPPVTIPPSGAPGQQSGTGVIPQFQAGQRNFQYRGGAGSAPLAPGASGGQR